MVEKARYIDADEFIKMVYGSTPYIATGYQNSDIERALDLKIQEAVSSALRAFTANLASAIERSAKPYSQCMLCTRKDHDPNPYDTNR